MKVIKTIILIVTIIATVSSCQSSNVVSKFGIQKRKYTKGLFVSKPKAANISSKNKKNYSKIKKENNSKKKKVYSTYSKENREVKITKRYKDKKVKHSTNTKDIFTKKKKSYHIKYVVSENIDSLHTNKTNQEETYSSLVDVKKPKEYEDLNWFTKILALIPSIILVTGGLILITILGALFESAAILLLISSLVIPSVVGLSFQFKEVLPLGYDYWTDVFVISGWVLALFVLSILVMYFVSMSTAALLSFFTGLLLVCLIAVLLGWLIGKGIDSLNRF